MFYMQSNINTDIERMIKGKIGKKSLYEFLDKINGMEHDLSSMGYDVNRIQAELNRMIDSGYVPKEDWMEDGIYNIRDGLAEVHLRIEDMVDTLSAMNRELSR